MRPRVALLVALALAALPRAARATPEPWSDTDPAEPPSRVAVGESGIRASAEYRANALLLRSLSTSPAARDASWIEHRLRLDAGLDYRERVRVVTSIDALDGALWGDNGPDASSPRIATTNPNDTRICLAPSPGDPTEPGSYALAACGATALGVRRLYGEALLPVGLVRIGRQAYDDGSGVLVADADGRRNRFGLAYRGDNVDRVLFATKPLELLEPDPDASPDRGLFVFLAYDRVAGGDPQRFADDANEWVTAVRLLEPGVGAMRELDARLFHAYRWQRSAETDVHAIGGRLSYRAGEWSTGFDAAAVLGSTRELGRAYRVVAREDSAPAVDVRQIGFRAVGRWDVDFFGAYLELDYASGDASADPRAGFTRFSFAQDTNVGLLLFDHVLAYQSARAAAADAALIRALGGDDAAASAAQVVATRGAFTNALAVFPQMDVRPRDDLLLRVGALFVTAPSDVVDPVRSLERRTRGVASPDVNLAGGRPSSAYGTELDARAEWRYADHLEVDVEGAVLLPGAALADAAGRVPHASMLQGRATVFF